MTDSVLTVMQACVRHGLVPSRVAEAADGGLVIGFILNDCYSDIECGDDGSVVATFDVYSDGRVTTEMKSADDVNALIGRWAVIAAGGRP
jgi:hypothetical protein